MQHCTYTPQPAGATTTIATTTITATVTLAMGKQKNKKVIKKGPLKMTVHKGYGQRNCGIYGLEKLPDSSAD
ncbi:hypothetical protein E2C01_094108 [Portunus trituberculatus]|uniref:Uncharacterized protein n=1 Tax=Portunus trituberculatus TaxID=210409 RepID=A0A5B7JZX9_PORTR|nr:hypothetical protein [Portunus trituberculatus]